MFPLALALGEVGEILYSFGRVFFEKFADDRALRSVESGVGSWLAWH
jgi:hypothetical protein